MARKRIRISLGIWIFLIIGSLVALTAGGALVATFILGDRFARQSAAEAVDASQSVRTVLQQQRYRQLQLISRIFESERLLTTYLAEAAEARDPASILESLEGYQNRLSFDLAVVLDVNGIVLARTDDRQAFGEDLSADPIVTVALEEMQAFGTWPQGDDLFHAVALPLVSNFDQVGFIIVAFSINDALARQIQRIGDAETVFLTNSPTGPAVAASTLAPATATELVSGLRLKGEILGRVTQRGETVDKVDLEVLDRSYVAFLAPLRDAAEAPIGAAVTLTSLNERLSDYRLLQLLLLGLGTASVIAGLLAAQVLSRRTQQPLSLLATAAERAGQGDYSAPLPTAGSGEIGQLRDSLDGLLGELGGKQALEHFVSRINRYLPEPGRGVTLDRPQANRATLLAIELRRFANPKIGHDPEEALGRMSRDLHRIQTATTSRQGRLEAVSGHRVLASFIGDGGAFRALSAATEVLHLLSERENVFDEAEPPVVTLAGGPVVTGSVVWNDQPSPAVAGLPIHQLESLLREATPGEIFLSKAVHAELAETFQRTGAEVRMQRGLLSPQPLIALSSELAAHVTGFVAPAASATTASGFPGQNPTLADVRPGAVLGNRYDVLAELGAGQRGAIYKAQDRELGDLVVLKMLKPEIASDPSRFERLRQVIQQARTLRHPNILGVLDFAETDGMLYVAVEFVRATNLRFLLDRGGRMGLAAGLYLARQLGWGLAAAHREGLLHLGIKPENVLVEPQGQAKWMDFGFSAPSLSGAVSASIGSGAAYLAPEQLEGQAGDSRTDVYALGVVLYEMFTGQTPYSGASPDEIRQQHLMQDPAPPSTMAEAMPPQLEQIILRSLAKTADQRHGSVEEWLAELEAVRPLDT